MTDNCLEFCGKVLRYPYELYLAISQIKHSNTQVHKPMMNRFYDPLHRMVADEFVKIAFLKKIYKSLAELQADLCEFPEHYNYKCTHQGYRMLEKPPMKAFEHSMEATRKDVKKAA